MFSRIPDHRRTHARRYDLAQLLFFCVLGIMSGAHSYRRLHLFIDEHFERLSQTFDLHKWRKPPAYSTIRNIIQGIDKNELELAFREYSLQIAGLDPKQLVFISLDGKTLRGSFDHFADQAALQLFSVFLSGKDIILAHEDIEEQKTNEIPVAQDLIKELGLKSCVFTLDALHCQKKL